MPNSKYEELHRQLGDRRDWDGLNALEAQAGAFADDVEVLPIVEYDLLSDEELHELKNKVARAISNDLCSSSQSASAPAR